MIKINVTQLEIWLSISNPSFHYFARAYWLRDLTKHPSPCRASDLFASPVYRWNIMQTSAQAQSAVPMTTSSPPTAGPQVHQGIFIRRLFVMHICCPKQALIRVCRFMLHLRRLIPLVPPTLSLRRQSISPEID